MKCTVIVAATNASGSPQLVRCQVDVTPEHFYVGDHYDMAILKLKEDGYEGPMVCFDPFELSTISQAAQDIETRAGELQAERITIRAAQEALPEADTSSLDLH